MSTILHRQTWPGLFIYLLKLLYIKIVVLITFRIHKGSLTTGWRFPLALGACSDACLLFHFNLLQGLYQPLASNRMLCSLVQCLHGVLHTEVSSNGLGWEYFCTKSLIGFNNVFKSLTVAPRTAVASSEKQNSLLLLFSTE